MPALPAPTAPAAPTALIALTVLAATTQHRPQPSPAPYQNRSPPPLRRSLPGQPHRFTLFTFPAAHQNTLPLPCRSSPDLRLCPAVTAPTALAAYLYRLHSRPLTRTPS